MVAGDNTVLTLISLSSIVTFSLLAGSDQAMTHFTVEKLDKQFQSFLEFNLEQTDYLRSNEKLIHL